MTGGKVDWKPERVIAKVREEATPRMVAMLTTHIEALTKRNITNNGQVDTGFMRASVYSLKQYRRSSTYGTAQGAALTDDGIRRSRRRRVAVNVANRMAPEQTLPEGVLGAVVVGANYAIYQELKKPFLYPAAEEAAAQAPDVIGDVGREVMHD